MTLDAKARAVSEKVIAKYGKSIVYTATKPGMYNADTGGATPANTTKTIKAIVEDIKGRSLGGGLVETNDKKLTIAAKGLTFEPSPSDTFKIGADSFTVGEDGVRAIWSGEQVAIYEVKASR